MPPRTGIVLSALVHTRSPTHTPLLLNTLSDIPLPAYEEMYCARIGVGAATGMYTPTGGEMAEMAAFGAFCEATRQWGRDERAKLGL